MVCKAIFCTKCVEDALDVFSPQDVRDTHHVMSGQGARRVQRPSRPVGGDLSAAAKPAGRL